MKVLLKSILKFFSFSFIKFTSSFNAGRYLNDLIIKDISKNKIQIVHKKLNLLFILKSIMLLEGKNFFKGTRNYKLDRRIQRK